MALKSNFSVHRDLLEVVKINHHIRMNSVQTFTHIEVVYGGYFLFQRHEKHLPPAYSVRHLQQGKAHARSLGLILNTGKYSPSQWAY